MITVVAFIADNMYEEPTARPAFLRRLTKVLYVLTVPVLLVVLVGGLAWLWWCVFLVPLLVWLWLGYRDSRRRRHSRQRLVALFGTGGWSSGRHPS